jgi:cyclopropane-fatty-acyl-phospholipid synthase
MSPDIVPRRPHDPTRARPGWERACRRLLLGLLARSEAGFVRVSQDGQECSVGRRGSDLKATVEVHRPQAWPEIALHGAAGLGSSYLEGWWDTDDLTSLLRILTRALSSSPSRVWERLARDLSGLSGPLRRRRPVDLQRDRDNVRAHYDLSDELFACFLDPTMAYSCGIFDSPAASLEEASVAKFDRLCRKLDLGPDDHLLEIGTGWGGLAVHAARHYGARVTTTTISRRQYDYARDLVARQGLTGRVEVLDRDYRELSGTYDKLVSVEMIEAVDWRHYDTFFATCSRLLSPEGRMVLQSIVIADQAFERSKYRQDFIKAVIFPGGCLPSITALMDTVTRASDMRLTDLEDIGRHYPETLSRWRSAFHANEARVSALGYDRRFQRMWDFYLSYCEAGFLERHISDVQMVLAKAGWRPTTLAPRTP